MTVVVNQYEATLTVSISRDEQAQKRHTQGKPSEKDSKDVVDELDVEEKHAQNVVSGAVHAAEVHKGVDCCGKGTVQPTSTLTDEFRSSFRDVGLAFGGFDICQVPFAACLGDEFEAKNTILGQEHVFLEDVHAFDAFWTELFGKSVITMEVLFQRSAHDGTETVCREGAR